MDITLLRREVWHGGQLLAFSGLDGKTDFHNGLTARTAFDAPAIDLKLPGACRLHFPNPTKILLAGDFLELETGAGPVRGAFLDACHLLLEGPVEVSRPDPEIAVLRDRGRTLVGSAGRFQSFLIHSSLDEALSARKRWLKTQALPPGSSGVRARTLAKVLSLMKTQVYTPEGRIHRRFSTPDRWPHRAMWLWDSVFHAIGWRHLDPRLAREMIEAVLDIQAPDGFIAHASDPAKSSQVTQPPVLALGTQMVQEVDPQLDWIEHIYPQLCAYIEWDLAHRDSDGLGLAEWAIEADPNCRSGESGMDNSPRFDSANPLDAVDFNSFLALECQILADFSRQMGREDDAGRWMSRCQRLRELINRRLWSPGEGFYLDYDLKTNQPSPVLASTGFLPLICGAAGPEQVQALASHLEDAATFRTSLRVPSIASQDTAHYAKDMWRGPVWVNLNWLIGTGFARAGQTQLAAELRDETMAEIERTCEQFGTLFEFFDDRREVEPPALLRKGRCAPGESPYHQVIHDYGWTATLYLDWAWQTAREGHR